MYAFSFIFTFHVLYLILVEAYAEFDPFDTKMYPLF